MTGPTLFDSTDDASMAPPEIATAEEFRSRPDVMPQVLSVEVESIIKKVAEAAGVGAESVEELIAEVKRLREERDAVSREFKQFRNRMKPIPRNEERNAYIRSLFAKKTMDMFDVIKHMRNHENKKWRVNDRGGLWTAAALLKIKYGKPRS